jgi:hypothetical protein
MPHYEFPDGARPITLCALVFCACAILVAAQTSRPEPAMVAAAKALLATLDDGQRSTIVLPFNSDERMNWNFVPMVRKGLTLKDMNESQRTAAFALLRAGLSEKGLEKAEKIRSLENVLFAIEKNARRDPELYVFTIFGEPSERGTWGWRYEGHHISQNWTMANGKATSTTPAFFGANPAEVLDGPLKGTRALAAEEDLARALLVSLTDAQRQQAVIGTPAPPDILTSNSRKAAILENAGIPASALDTKQRELLMKLIDEHAGSQTSALAQARLAKVRAADLGAVRFAWMGPTEKAPGNGNYYRIQGPTFLIEYDNTQTRANHQHIVWRDFDGDFGVDVLGAHYAFDPHHRGRSLTSTER